VDIGRLTDEVGYTPRQSTVEAVEEWAAGTRQPARAGAAA
jgi:hypothetical protein